MYWVALRNSLGQELEPFLAEKNHSVACEQVFDQTKHVRKITLDGKVHNNNKMESMNGEIRGREKTMRGLKQNRTPILTSYQLYHNCIKPHEAFDGKTPS